MAMFSEELPIGGLARPIRHFERLISTRKTSVGLIDRVLGRTSYEEVVKDKICITCSEPEALDKLLRHHGFEWNYQANKYYLEGKILYVWLQPAAILLIGTWSRDEAFGCRDNFSFDLIVPKDRACSPETLEHRERFSALLHANSLYPTSVRGRSGE